MTTVAQTPLPVLIPPVGPLGVAMAEPWPALVKDYLRDRRRRGTVNATSAQTYRSVLGRLAFGLTGVPLDAHADQLLDAVEEWIDATGWSTTTRCTNLGIIRPFLEWAAAKERVRGGVAFRLRNPRRPKPLPRALKASQVNTLLSQGVPDVRGTVVVLLEGQCGLRRAEVAAIRWPTDVDLNDRTILVHGKGGVERMVYLSEETAGAIRHWLGQRGSEPGDADLRLLLDAPSHPDVARNPGRPVDGDGRSEDDGPRRSVRPCAPAHGGHNHVAVGGQHSGRPGGHGPRLHVDHCPLPPGRRRRGSGRHVEPVLRAAPAPAGGRRRLTPQNYTLKFRAAPPVT